MTNDPLEFLDELSISWEKSLHDAVPTVEAANEVWANIEGTHCKNLFFRDKKGKQHYLLVAEKDRTINIRAIDQLLGNERLSFASERRMEKYLKLKPGSVSPFGLINDEGNHVIALIDAGLKESRLINFHPNVNTATVTIFYKDFLKFLEASGNPWRYIELNS